MKYFLNAEETLTSDIILRILKNHGAEVARLTNLDNYYCSRSKILSRQVADATKPNHKIAHPYAEYITDTLVGYLVGEPITYTSVDESLDSELGAILTYNDVAALDTELAQDISIYGKGYELHYIDEDGAQRFTSLETKDVIIIYDDTIEHDILYAIRIIPTYDIKNDKRSNKVEVYSRNNVVTFDSDEMLTSLTLVDEQPHYFGIVPIVEYKNNKREMGDFESCISLIDAYDSLESDALNDYDYFTDCYLMLTGLNADSDDIAQMKENRVILLDDADSKAEWLIKSESDTVSENLKNRFKNDIHKFSKTPDLSDEAFSNNASGIAIKYKLYGTESLAGNKERFMVKGLQRRMELICNILNLKNNSYDYKSIEITFTRNIPTNETEIADVVQKLSGLVSTETLLAQIPFVSDVKEELEKRKDTEEASFYEFSNGSDAVNG